MAGDAARLTRVRGAPLERATVLARPVDLRT